MHLSSAILAIGALLPAASSLQLKQDAQAVLSSLKSPTPIDIPHLGFGTWNLKPDAHNASAAVSHAIQTGYRHIDCAAAYRNEADVGRGIKDGLKKAGLKREDIWVTSKLWNNAHGPKQVASALDKTLTDLDVGYLDLYLMHWPVAEAEDGSKSISFLPTWMAMSLLPVEGKVRHVGISNFSPAQLKELLDSPFTTVKPFAHQFELHPYLPQTSWLLYHAQHGIHVTAYSPLGNANPTYGSKGDVQSLIDTDTVKTIAAKRACTPAQVVLAWGLSRGTSVIPKSSHAQRIEENFGATDCELEFEDFETLHKLGMKPVRFNNPSKSWGVNLYDGLQDS